MSMVLNKWCSYSNLATHTKHKETSLCLIRCKQVTKKKHAGTCVKAMLGPDGDEFRSLRRIMRLNSAIQNRSAKEFFDLACDECKYVFTSLPPFNPLSLSKRMFGLLYALMLQNNVTFVIQPTTDGGFDINMRWKLEHGYHLPLPFGGNVNTSHAYRGNMTLGNTIGILEHIWYIAKFPQKLEEKLMLLMDGIVPKDKLDGKKREAFMYFIVSVVVMLIYYTLMHKLA